MARLNARPSTGKLICEGCGCTDDNACPGGCYWVSRKPPVCSACVDSVTPPKANHALYGIPEQADLATADGVAYGADRCPASPTPALHLPIWVSDTEGYCARCRCGFAA